MNWAVFVAFLVVWVLSGLVTGLWMARRGHDPRWTIIAVILGPLFVPIAFERIERVPRSVEVTTVARQHAGEVDKGGLRVMVGYDGSTEAKHALDAARRLFGPSGGVLELVVVISYDDAGDPDSELLATVRRRLEEAVESMGDISVGYAVLAGPAGRCLGWFAEEHHADVLVVGRRGRGMSSRMLGSVAEYLIGHSHVPVLVVDPTVVSPDGGTNEPTVAVRVAPEENVTGTASN
ncbi:universal stress protein [Rhodococcus pyridinivorans]|uniref:universal stress protein n=1 Tax=Rhodococcus pyridinivorans TaxID=103816 RepID=UPI003AAC666C